MYISLSKLEQMVKSVVKEHTRKTKGGKIVQVRQHEDIRSKKTAKAPSMSSGLSAIVSEVAKHDSFETAYAAFKHRTGIPKEVADEFQEKFGEGGELSPDKAFRNLYEHATGGSGKDKEDPEKKPGKAIKPGDSVDTGNRAFGIMKVTKVMPASNRIEMEKGSGTFTVNLDEIEKVDGHYIHKTIKKSLPALVPYLLKSRSLHGRMNFQGLNISVENRKGSIRQWYDPHNKENGTTRMKCPYGYIRMTEGSDGDHVDCYVGPHKDAKSAYIVHQMKAPEFKTYDEQKCMLGFASMSEAKSAYLAHYNDKRFLGSMTTMPMEQFKDKVLATKEKTAKIIKSMPLMWKKRRVAK
jgi:hypothetical protein